MYSGRCTTVPKPQGNRGSPWSWSWSHRQSRSATSRQCSRASKEHRHNGRPPQAEASAGQTSSELHKLRLSFLLRATYDNRPCPRTSPSGLGVRTSARCAAIVTQASGTSCQGARLRWCRGASGGGKTRF